MVLEAIRYKPGKLQILDQLLLPHQESWVEIHSVEDAWQAIRSMKVRGAPAIAIVAALSVALEQWNILGVGTIDTRNAIVRKLQYLLTSRPTAVNLADAVAKLTAITDEASHFHEEGRGATGGDVKAAFIAAVEKMLKDDVADNQAIGENGARWILENVAAAQGFDRLSVMTHCNTGSLATAGYGTALGIVRSLHSTGRLARTFYGETRPYNQGSRLTGYELLHDGIPATLVTDSMAGALMAQKGPRPLAHVGRAASISADVTSGANGSDSAPAPLLAVIVGADRVAANGDTANKIGTYGLAVLARQHGIAFVVAAPRTTVDLGTATGADIVIEERRQREVTVIKGPTVSTAPATEGGRDSVDLKQVREVSIAPLDTHAWNPAFDVTPAELIDAIVTEVGVAVKRDGKFVMGDLF